MPSSASLSSFFPWTILQLLSFLLLFFLFFSSNLHYSFTVISSSAFPFDKTIMIHWSLGTLDPFYCFLLSFSHFLYLLRNSRGAIWASVENISSLSLDNTSFTLLSLCRRVTIHLGDKRQLETQAIAVGSFPLLFYCIPFIYLISFLSAGKWCVLSVGGELPNAAGKQSDRHSLSLSDA